jgi:hypothetical protein
VSRFGLEHSSLRIADAAQRVGFGLAADAENRAKNGDAGGRQENFLRNSGTSATQISNI